MADAHPKFDVAVVTPEGDAFRGEAEMLIVPGAAGEIGVLARHAPLVATLKAGSTRVHLGGGETLEFATGSGFFKVELDRAIALVDDAVDVREIDDARAQEQLEAAKAELERVDAGESKADRWQLEQRIKHAENQLTVAGRTLEACERRSPRSARSRRGRCSSSSRSRTIRQYRPGHYFWVELPDRGHEDEKGLRRHISFVTSPTESGVVGLATRLRDTAFKQTLAELQVGDEVEVEEPKGSFLLPEDTSADVRVRRRWNRDHRLPLDAALHRRRGAAVPRHARLLRTATASRPRSWTSSRSSRGGSPGLRVVLTMTEDEGWEGESRRIDAELLREHVGDLEDKQFLVAGPPAMAEAVVDALHAAGVPEDSVLAGKFSGY